MYLNFIKEFSGDQVISFSSNVGERGCDLAGEEGTQASGTPPSVVERGFLSLGHRPGGDLAA